MRPKILTRPNSILRLQKSPTSRNPNFSTLASSLSCPTSRSPFRSPPSHSRRDLSREALTFACSVFPASRASGQLSFSKIGAKQQPSRSRTRSEALTSAAATSPNLFGEAHQVIAARSSDFEFRYSLRHGKFICSFGRFLINVGEESVMEEAKIYSNEIKDKNDHVDQDSSTSSVNEVKLPEIGMTFSSEEEIRIVYSSYAQNVGFGICKLGSRNGDDGK
ncbi:hypothetical protein ZIOFF_016283 [Zingiber officinale]|uniref:Uncharacterized protein n=1 Tax=Zingiber officinale TaxID=94328 RepID=A0A8J5HJR6_ZINOF|nr:hypothetical protein ZIOFF_016283 [Zingiber officinale]